MDKYICFQQENMHTLSKPYQIKSNPSKIFQNGIWDYSALRDSSHITILPFLSLQEANTPSLATRKLNYSSGLQFNYLSSNLFSQIRIGFQKGFVDNSRFSFKRPYAPSAGYLDDTNSFSYNNPIFQGIFSYKINDYITLCAGNEKNTFGDGYRSLWLSRHDPNPH